MQRFASAQKRAEPINADREIFEILRDEMRLVEAEFQRQASSNIQVIDYLGDYLTASGGKRVRPALLILANYAVGGDGSSESVIRLATVMEMLHTATLVHDDIIDNAKLRRNLPSLNAQHGNQTAVLMGDWLYMSAFETTANERSLEIIDILTRVTRKMTEGELIQLTRVGRLDISESEYFDILCRKTAYLFSACCEVGAILAGASLAKQHALRDYGMNLGIAFQLSDDLLDITAETENLGKLAGSDLLEGKVTLPIIQLLEAEPTLAPQLGKVMSRGDYGELSREHLKQKLTDFDVFNRVKQQAQGYARSAKKSLAYLPPTAYRKCMEEILSFVTNRKN
ncbi:MAG: polyprenyl synthetase family protein [Pyrinomonadaceae bacterium]